MCREIDLRDCFTPPMGDSRGRYFSSVFTIVEPQPERPCDSHSAKHDSPASGRHSVTTSAKSIADEGFRYSARFMEGVLRPCADFFALPKRLKEYGFSPMKTDVCVYPKREARGELTGIQVAQVGDLLLREAAEFRKSAIRRIQTVRAGELEILSHATPIVFTGLTIGADQKGAIIVS